MNPLKTSLFLVAAIVAASVLIAANPEPATDSPAPWKAGVARADITPELPIWMSGYASRKAPAEKIMAPLHAKALAIEDAQGGRLVIVTMDLIGVPRHFRDTIEAYCKTKHQLPGENLVLNASHTHCGPMIRTYQREGRPERVAYSSIPEEQAGQRIAETHAYLEMLTGKVQSIIDQALASLEPAAVSYAHSSCGFAMNRRTADANGNFQNFPNPDGPVDHSVPVLQVKSVDGENLRAVMFGYACHATTLSLMEINGDWPGFAQAYFEADHPGTTAMFLNGCSGNQNPYPRRMTRFVENHGRSMATAIEAALETKAKPVQGSIRAALEWVPVAYGKAPTREELEKKAQSADKYDARHGELLLEELDHAGKLPESYPVPVQVVKLGDDFSLVTLGGEVVVEYALRLKEELGHGTENTVWVAGYSNDVMAYIPNKRILEEGGYEGKFSFRYPRTTIHPAPWAPEIEETLVGKVLELNEKLGTDQRAASR